MEGGFFMTKNEQVEYHILTEFREGRKSRKQAALLLGISERAVSRRVAKLRKSGVSGIKHGNYRRAPVNKVCDQVREDAMQLMKNDYFDFNASHAHEKLRDEHNFDVSYVTFLGWCKASGLARSKRRRPAKARIHRERMANEGVLLQMDGSHHKWNGRDKWCLISLIDDATSNIAAGQFYKGETSWNCMDLLKKLFENRGIPQFLYTDGAGWAGGGQKRQHFSQVVRACEELGIKIIRANSAQAKGRIERSYRTIQDRLVPEMRLKGIESMKDANRYLDQVFWPDWNNRFSVQARDEVSRYRSLQTRCDLNEILCMKYDRQVLNDHTVSYGSKRFKLNPGRFRTLRRKKITIHEYKDESIRIFHGGEVIEHDLIVLPKRRWI